ncbi:MAG: GNAT family N-acetyltransferase [Lysobacter sp.]|nr:GNAT family N-acetyltransferase [Lysobacter sp.]
MRTAVAPLRRLASPLGGAEVPGWWLALHQRAPRASLFTSAAWMQTWLEVYGELFGGEWVRWERDGEVVAGCLLLRGTLRRRGLLRLRAVFVNATGETTERTPLAEFNDVLCLPGEEDAVALDFARLLGEEPWSCVFLSGYEGGGVLDTLARTLPSAASSHEVRPAPFVDLAALPEGRFEDSLGGSTRSQVRRSRRGYEERSGPVRLEFARTEAEAGEFLDGLARLHNARWRARGMQGSFESDRVLRFHRRLVGRLLPEGGVDLVRGRSGDDDVGYLLNYRDRGKICFFQSGFAYEEDSKLKPGLLTHCMAIEHYRGTAAREYDFLAGDARYKRSLAGGHRDLRWSVVYRDSAWMRLLFRLRDALRSFARQGRAAGGQEQGE